MGEFCNRTIREFLDALSSANPTPGGGSVAALSAAIAASLGAMVCALASKKSTDPLLTTLAGSFAKRRTAFTQLASQDETAFDAVMAAYRIPREDPRRTEAIQSALRGAAEVPLATARSGVALLDDLRSLVPLGTKQSTSDTGVAALLGRAAIEAAVLNVRVNLAYLAEGASKTHLREEGDALERQAWDLTQTVLAGVAERLAT